MEDEKTSGTRNLIWRSTLIALSGLAGLAAVTLSPVFALWIGSQLQGRGLSPMFSIIAVILCLLGFSLLILKALLLLNNAYRAAAGMPSKYRRLAWLRSMRDDPRDYAPLTGPEKALLAVVFLAIIVLLIWFFFFAHYNLGV